MKKRGFTLAELLITLVIIGVIAAVALPQFITGMHNQSNASRLSTTITDYENIFGMMMQKENKSNVFETEFGKAWASDNQDGMKTAMAKYTQIARSSNNTSGLGYISSLMENMTPVAQAAPVSSCPVSQINDLATYKQYCAPTREFECPNPDCFPVCVTYKCATYGLQYDTRCTVANENGCAANLSTLCKCPGEGFHASETNGDNCVATGSLNPSQQSMFNNQGSSCGASFTARPNAYCCPRPCPEGRTYETGSSQPWEGCNRNGSIGSITGWCCPPMPCEMNPNAECCAQLGKYYYYWEGQYRCWDCPENLKYKWDNACHECPQNQPFRYNGQCHKCDVAHGYQYKYNQPSGWTCSPALGGGYCCKQSGPNCNDNPCASGCNKPRECCESKNYHWIDNSYCCETTHGHHWSNNMCCDNAHYHHGGCQNCTSDYYRDGACQDCPNGKPYMVEGVCQKCPPGQHEYGFPSSCHNCEYGLFEHNGGCHPCDEAHYYNNKCHKCRQGLWPGGPMGKCIPCEGGVINDDDQCILPSSESSSSVNDPLPTPFHKIGKQPANTDDISFDYAETDSQTGANIFYSKIVEYTDASNNTRRAATIYVDVNGKSWPNAFGRDVFALVLDQDGHLYPYGSEKAAAILTTNAAANTWKGSAERYGCTNKGSYNGLGCTARLVENHFKVDY